MQIIVLFIVTSHANSCLSTKGLRNGTDFRFPNSGYHATALDFTVLSGVARAEGDRIFHAGPCETRVLAAPCAKAGTH
jgi:hypothetical protein